VAKITASAEQIQAAMQNWIKTSSELEGGCRHCEAPLPMPLASPRNGANWTIGYVKAMPGCQQFMDRIVERAKREYELG
jgi:hypothetical protein